MPISRTWIQNYALYSASLARLGNFVDAGFVASVLFEKYIEKCMTQYGLTRSTHGEFMYAAIEQLALFDNHNFPKEELHALRKIRNRYVIHGDEVFEEYNHDDVRERIRGEVEKLVHFVWEKFDPTTFADFQVVRNIPLLRADYAVMGIKEYFQDDTLDINATDRCIESEDFQDLLRMRKHFLHLEHYLENGLLKKHSNLEVDLISHVDSTSAYVWMAINRVRSHPDHKLDRFYHASASITATPLDLRIYIGFGGEAYNSCLNYFHFLRTDEFRDFVDNNSELIMFDVDWYTFIVLQEAATDCVMSENFENKLDNCLDMLREYQEQRRIITWGRMLTGYILDKNTLEYSMLAKKLNNILLLYNKFELYCEKLKVGDYA